MKLTNRQMDEYLYFLDQLAIKTKGKLAFAVAKNMRILQNELLEYNKVKDGLIQKYGEINSEGIYQINTDSVGFKDFLEEMRQYNEIESDVNIIMVSSEDIYNSDLNGQEMMQLLFMTKDEEVTNESSEQNR